MSSRTPDIQTKSGFGEDGWWKTGREDLVILFRFRHSIDIPGSKLVNTKHAELLFLNLNIMNVHDIYKISKCRQKV